jgi:uncharacterized phage protein (TIGR02220 family)
MITIIKWDQYQSCGEPAAKQVASRRQTTDRQVTTNKKLIIKEVKNTFTPESLVIDYYNRVNGRSLKQVDSNYKEIRTRFKEGYSVDEMKELIDYAASTWTKDQFWADKNRPSTLFSGKFDGYLQTAKASLRPKMDPLMALVKKHLDESVLTDSKEEK